MIERPPRRTLLESEHFIAILAPGGPSRAFSGLSGPEMAEGWAPLSRQEILEVAVPALPEGKLHPSERLVLWKVPPGHGILNGAIFIPGYVVRGKDYLALVNSGHRGTVVPDSTPEPDGLVFKFCGSEAIEKVRTRFYNVQQGDIYPLSADYDEARQLNGRLAGSQVRRIYPEDAPITWTEHKSDIAVSNCHRTTCLPDADSRFPGHVLQSPCLHENTHTRTGATVTAAAQKEQTRIAGSHFKRRGPGGRNEAGSFQVRRTVR